MRKKKIENPYVKNKMRIFGNVLSERNKASIEKEIKSNLESISRTPNSVNRQSSDINQEDMVFLSNSQDPQNDLSS